MLPPWTDAETGVQVVRLTEPEEVEALVRLFEGIAEAEGWQPEGALRPLRPRGSGKAGRRPASGPAGPVKNAALPGPVA